MPITTHKLRWGILGAARINERLLPAIVQADNAELVAIASRRPGAAAETLNRFAPCYPSVTVYDAPEDLLNDPNVQAVYIPLANHEHAQWTLRAIGHGKHVLCEKPLALSVSDIHAIQAAAHQHQVMVMEGFMYQFHPQHARVQELVQSELLGDIRSVRATFSFMMRPERMYRLEAPIAQGGGAMWDIGCYAIHTVRSLFGQDPIAVTALHQTLDSGADIAASGVLDFGDGKFGQFDFSFARARRSEYEIIGTKGGLKCHVVWQLPGDVPVLTWWTDDGRQTEERLPAANHFRLEVEHFSHCVLSGTAPKLSLDDAHGNCRTIVAALQSAAEGRKVSLA
ncbi:Gfo/Idh/MocA family protein [Methylovulum psychrotolerans]|uniref:Gfo/Idh/MocA family oxidoreductase n=1 Tax=Methylovulum psychrotolerans TaxID=1704499 RepID=A0A2S5CK33_9GAMM|nr:Gfo/Idh/MocA family oxidoreductase [Methylovulum psychrotolerans]POZ51134.1 gfo/Idh/MocA family oxidoreductase [Methylovulum psychrotolerans]